ncbi:TonB-dependent receptor [Aliikangiella coralliicola]|uniref:TonB-dependent receptor n=1 Tax=Aliikangiella coralliicola TaxID=2592383 RepID=A0A545UGI2_9GAMM|nr:TonB-dependent receptor [Aliikangiella coralliicola]TQV88578.1 TonB-dependent receptor [Aliikangiella coralliicola]
MFIRFRSILGVFYIAISLFSFSVTADEKEDKEVEEPATKENVLVIVGDVVGELSLFEESSTASRLGLSSLETPATVETITSDVMRARGYQKLSDAIESLPGVVTGEHPTAPSTFSIRGFTRGQVTVLRDGLWIGPSTMVMRPQNTFNLEKIEVLRGPSSVVNGIGAVAGTVNAITRTAKQTDTNLVETLVSYGEFNSHHLGVNASGKMGEKSWYNVSVSDYGSDGYVDRTDLSSTNLNASGLWHINENLGIKFSVDHLEDDVGSYFGTPLVPISVARDPLTSAVTTERGETLDGATRFNNYNVEDAVAESEQTFWRLDFDWQLADNMRLQNTTYSFDAEREWLNAEGYVYCTQVVGTCTEIGTVQRYYGYFMLDHEQDLIGNRTTLNIDSQFGDMDNRFVIGAETISVDFERARGFRRSAPQVPGDAVDLYDVVPGVYGPRELRGISPTEIDTLAIFAENALQVNDDFNLVAALRYDEMDLDRKNFNASGELEANGFSREYDWTSWRLGAVYNIADKSMIYAQYSDAKDPINSNIFLVNNNQDFDLTSAKQWEVGMKSIWMDGNAETTISYFDIQRDDIFERFSLDSATNVGGRESNGIEISLTMTPSENWRFGANASYTNAEFLGSANFETLAGNTPPNVAEVTANTWLSYNNFAELPLEIGFEWHHVGDRYGDNANTVKLKSYALFDIFAAWKADNYRISFRVDNAFDEEYVPWSDVFYLHQDSPGFIYANQLMLGAPRTYRLSLETNF